MHDAAMPRCAVLPQDAGVLTSGVLLVPLTSHHFRDISHRGKICCSRDERLGLVGRLSCVSLPYRPIFRVARLLVGHMTCAVAVPQRGVRRRRCG
jgi:hypothetical protein